MREIRPCLRKPIPEIADAARYLDAAVSAHLAGHRKVAESLIRLADMQAVREWTESVWGKNSSYVQYRPVPGAAANLKTRTKVKTRMPTAAEKRQLLARDGFHCRFCGIPLIRREIRERIRKVYPHALQWGKQNPAQHAAFQAMWAQYDHVVPHARGGTNLLDNIVVTCAPCNFGRMHYELEEVGLQDPRTRERLQSQWDGLERFQ